jgi:hypothetical protein
MDRAYESGAIASAPPPPSPPLLGYPTEVDTPTVPGAWWFYMMTEEMRAAIVAAGIAPSATVVNQLAQAIQAMGGSYAADTGAVNALVVALAPALTARAPGLSIRVKAKVTNTGNCTINDGLGAVALLLPNGAQVPAGVISANGIYVVTWDGAQYELTGGNAATAATAASAATAGSATTAGTATNVAGGGTVSATTGTFSSTVTAPAFNVSSDITLKHNVVPLTGARAKLRQLQAILYEMEGVPGTHAGISAQQLRAVQPELVAEDDEGKLQVNLYGLLGLVLAAVNEIADPAAVDQR